MDIFKKLEEISQNPLDYARAWKETHGRPVIGTFCSYTPEEFLHAAGALPLRLFGESANPAGADVHLQAYSCSLVRSTLAEALAGRLSFLSGAVFAHTCDCIQRLSDIWRMNAGFDIHLDVILPVKLNTASAREYYTEELRRFVGGLEKALGRSISLQRMQEALQTYNRIRGSLQKLYRMQNRQALPGRLLYSAVRASMIADREDLAGWLEEATAALEEHPAGEEARKKRVVLSGGLCRMPEIYQSIEEAGAVIVDDDLCTGRRFFDGDLEIHEDPVAAVAKRYLERVVCPAKHRGLSERGDRLLEQIKESRADGVIFLLPKFCDPHGFDYPYLKGLVDEAGVPNLFVELEEPMGSGGQTVTRIEAFVETL
jgi:bzd-type benzoyl-CoA reductase N subunit